jgi:hypothetical protein
MEGLALVAQLLLLLLLLQKPPKETPLVTPARAIWHGSSRKK